MDCKYAVDLISLDDTNSVGHIKGIVVLAQSHIALLQTPGSDECVDLFAFNVVKLLNSSLDLSLVGLNVNNKDQSVAVFDQFHRGLCCQGILDNRVLVQSGLLWYTGSCVFGLTIMLQSLRSEEVHLRVDTGALLGHSLLEGFGNSFSFA